MNERVSSSLVIWVRETTHDVYVFTFSVILPQRWDFPHYLVLPLVMYLFVSFTSNIVYDIYFVSSPILCLIVFSLEKSSLQVIPMVSTTLDF